MNETKVVVLGIAQDGGFPTCGCFREKCCLDAWNNPEKRRLPSCLAIIDGNSKWYIDLTIKFNEQLYLTKDVKDFRGALLTHAHTGHYFGLICFGKEMMNTKDFTFFVMPKMKKFLLENQPFEDIAKKNVLKEMENEREIQLSEKISIIPFLVPHRDEFSETIGVEIIGPRKRVIYIPDIDSWEEFKSRHIEKEAERVDLLFLDATFFKDGEAHRPMSEIPHPRAFDSIEKTFKNLKPEDKKKIHFIHLNHTNPLLNTESSEYEYVEKQGFNIAKQMEYFDI